MKIRINPMMKKELLVSVRGIRLTVLMLIFNTVLALIGLAVFYTILQEAQWSGDIGYATIIVLYITLSVIQFILIAFIVPAITASAISGERERQTLDILLSSSLTPAGIIMGKLSSSILSIVLLIVSSIPVMSLIFIFGGVSIGNILSMELFLIYITIFAGSIGIACSTRFKKTTSATIASYGLILFLGAGTLLIAGVASIIRYSWGSYSSSPGIIGLLLLFNPGFSLVSLLFKQVGSRAETLNFFIGVGTPSFINSHWFLISMLAQILLIVLLLLGSIRRLNPLKRRGKR